MFEILRKKKMKRFWYLAEYDSLCSANPHLDLTPPPPPARHVFSLGCLRTFLYKWLNVGLTVNPL